MEGLLSTGLPRLVSKRVPPDPPNAHLVSTHAGHEDTEAPSLGVLPEVAGDVEEASLQGQNKDDPLGRLCFSLAQHLCQCTW